jgi:hypothetical protein
MAFFMTDAVTRYKQIYDVAEGIFGQLMVSHIVCVKCSVNTILFQL